VEKIVDVTGAGNAYCGGFLVGLAETGDLAQAGRYGAVSASFALAQFGAMFPLDDLRDRAEQRLSILY
jgi:sugar/nucleoside kinase (ribokinase family)